jgi:ferrous iron transport protein A
MLDSPIPLSALEAGQTAHIRQILGPADHVHRLEEFGLRSGVRVEMFRPGSPCILRMAGSKVCVRADDRLRVLVVPCPSTSAPAL